MKSTFSNPWSTVLMLAHVLASCSSSTTEALPEPAQPTDAGRTVQDGGHSRRSDASRPPTLDAGDPEPEQPRDLEPVRFVILGDTGEGNEAQFEVGQAIEEVCAANGCDFVILAGDNFYDDGVSAVDDPQWQSKFEEPYAELDLPFYAVLGNHDYGGQFAFIDLPGIGNEWMKGPIEVQYSEVSEKWIMPATHYTFTRGNVGFIVLDTNSLLWGDTTHGDQAAWYPTAVMEVASSDWVIGVGHHPYRSNGPHGNAGNYDAPEFAGVEIPNIIPIQNGGRVRDFFDDHVCGTVDLYLSGHDHNRQWLNEPDALCGAELIVSGAGAKTSGIRDRGNEARFQEGDTEGFLYVVVEGNRLVGQFYNRRAELDFEQTLMR